MNTQNTTSTQDAVIVVGNEHEAASFKFNAARFDSVASSRVKSLADYLNARRIGSIRSTIEAVRVSALASLNIIASSKGVDPNSVQLFKATLSMPQEYLDKTLTKCKGSDIEATDIAAAKAVLADMAKKIALESQGFTVEWKE